MELTIQIFNANWTIDGDAKDLSLFQMIRNTHKLHPGNVISAYSDNASVMAGQVWPFIASYSTPCDSAVQERLYITEESVPQIKVS